MKIEKFLRDGKEFIRSDPGKEYAGMMGAVAALGVVLGGRAKALQLGATVVAGVAGGLLNYNWSNKNRRQEDE